MILSRKASLPKSSFFNFWEVFHFWGSFFWGPVLHPHTSLLHPDAPEGWWKCLSDSGSSLVDVGSWLVDSENWVVCGQCLLDRGNCLVNNASWLVDGGSWLVESVCWMLEVV